MPLWPYRYQLSRRHRLRRSIYEVFRDNLDSQLLRHALVSSYWNFTKANEPYPFVSKRELKPRARVTEKEFHHQNHFLVIFCEGGIPSTAKKYIRYFDHNKITKETLREQANVILHQNFTKSVRFFDNPSFGDLLLSLTPVDYAILIQQDTSIKKQNRYVMSHFHVRVDWPIDEATEDLVHHLRYISKDLYERGEKFALNLHHKLFENYGFHFQVGGRRTAAVVAAQFLKRMDFISTIYVASAEARSLTRISERGVSKYVLIKISLADIYQLIQTHQLSFDRFVEQYLVNICDDHGVGILQVVYRNSLYSKPPEDGKIRKFTAEYQWLNIVDQLLLPLMQENPDAYPLPYSIIYSADS